MKSYVEMAKKAAADKREKDAANLEKENIERDRKSSQVDEVMKSLKKVLKEWDKEEGFSYKDFGNSHIECAEICHNGKKLLGFQCCWDRWEAQYSDDCKSDVEGVAIKVTFCQERVQDYSQYQGYKYVTLVETFQYPREPAGLVDRCMETVAQYLSKFF